MPQTWLCLIIGDAAEHSHSFGKGAKGARALVEVRTLSWKPCVRVRVRVCACAFACACVRACVPACLCMCACQQFWHESSSCSDVSAGVCFARVFVACCTVALHSSSSTKVRIRCVGIVHQRVLPSYHCLCSRTPLTPSPPPCPLSRFGCSSALAQFPRRSRTAATRRRAPASALRRYNNCSQRYR